MFKQPKQVAPEQKAFGVSPKRISTNEQAIPLPWAVGHNRLALKWLCPAYNQTTSEIKQKVGKKTTTTGFNVYADVAGAICAGPVDRLERIWIDGILVWESAAAVRDVSHPHYYEANVPTYGKFRIYWGTSTQPKDTLIFNYIADRTEDWTPEDEPWEFPGGTIAHQPSTRVVHSCPDDHPAYLDQCYMVWSQLFCGQNRESVPNVEVEVAKSARFSTLDTEVTDEGVNPVAAIAELLTNDLFGAGLPASYIDVSQWDAVATIAANRRTYARPTMPGVPVSVPFGHLCVCVDRQTTVKSVLTDLFLYFDGFVRPRLGMLEIGCFPHDGVTPVDLTTLTLHDDTELPEYTPATWREIITQATVVHKDRDQSYNDNAETCANPQALSILGQPKRDSIARPYFVTRWQAQDYASRWARIHANPQNLVRGRIRVRRERAVTGAGAPLSAGDLFIFDYAPYATSLVCRCVSRNDPRDSGVIDLEFEAERGIAPRPTVPDVQPRPDLTALNPVPIINARVFQLPPAFLGDPAPAIVTLADRPAAHVLGYNVQFSTSDTTYDLVGSTAKWAVRGVPASPIGINDSTVTITCNSFDIVKLQPQTDAAKSDDTLLLFIGTEILSVGAVTAIGGGQYTVAVLRGRFGSAQSSHLVTDPLYVIPRSDLAVIQNANFPRTIAAQYFKLPTYIPNAEEDMAGALKLTFTFADTGVNVPTGLGVTASAISFFLQWTNPADADLDHIEIFERNSNTTPGVNDVPDFVSFSNFFTRAGVTAGTTKYYWIRAVDTIGYKSAFVGSVSGTATAVPSGSIDSSITTAITTAQNTANTAQATADGKNKSFYQTTAPVAGMVAGDLWFDTDDGYRIYRYNGSSWLDIQRVIASSDFGTGIEPVGMVAGLPSPAGYTGPKTVFNSADGQLYRYASGAWTAAVPAVNVTGQIIGTQITDGAVSAAKIAANTITASQIAAGTITASQIAANTITAGQIAAGSITATLIGANQIITSAANIADAVITSAKIATLDAGKISAGNITVALSLTSGSIKAAAGSASETLIDSGGLQVGRNSDYHISAAAYAAGQSGLMFYNGSGTMKGWLTLSAAGFSIMGTASGNDTIGAFDYIGGQYLRAYSSYDPRTTDAPLYSSGGAWIAGTLDARGAAYVAGILSVSGAITAGGGFSSSSLNIHPAASNQLATGEDAGTSGAATGTYLAMRVNGRTVWVPFFTAVP